MVKCFRMEEQQVIVKDGESVRAYLQWLTPDAEEEEEEGPCPPVVPPRIAESASSSSGHNPPIMHWNAHKKGYFHVTDKSSQQYALLRRAKERNPRKQFRS